METLRWRGSVIFLIITVSLATASRYDDFSDIYGPYCSNVGCCNGRKDQCGAPILGTMCYCDRFCDNLDVDDCCPDYWSVCLNMTTTTSTTPRPQYSRGCKDEFGNTVGLRRSIKENCRLCTCEPISRDVAELMCERDTCLIEPDMTNAINQMSQSLGWSATNYSEFWGHKLSEGIKLRLGTLKPHESVMTMNPVRRTYDPYRLPREFDADAEWPGKVTRIQDQGWCGSSWAISTAAVASDRYAIISDGLEQVQLSPQHLLSCDLKGQQGCAGGHLDKAWLFVRKQGLVDEQCFPYTGRKDSCIVPRHGGLQAAGCTPVRPERISKYRVSPIHRIGNETDIMYEILYSGPVQATIKVYHDFFTYRTGIYRQSDLSLSQDTGYHSVRIVGWGEERTRNGLEKYWKVANSWGRQWGEDGYFRIARGIDECEIESFVLGTWPLIEKNHNIYDNHLRRHPNLIAK